MPVYSEVLKNHEIMNLVNGKYENVLVVGCGSCMNESLSYLHGSPIFVRNGDEIISSSVITKITEIVSMLNANNIKATPAIIHIPTESNTLCMIDVNKKPYCFRSRPDVVLAMCCPSGIHGLNFSFPDGVKIIKISRQCGFLAYCYEDAEERKEDGSLQVTRCIKKRESKAYKF